MKTIRFFAVVVLMMAAMNVWAGNLGEMVKAKSLSTEDQKVYDQAEKNFVYEEYQTALPTFLKLLENNPEDLDLNYHVGMCYFFMKEKEKAVPYLEKASLDRTLKVKILFFEKLTENSSVIL